MAGPKSKGSKNNVVNRGAKVELKVYNGQKTIPVRYIDREDNKVFMMAVREDNGDPIKDANGEFVAYNSIL